MFVPKGVICPIVTPFKEDGSIDEENLRKHIKYLVNNGITAISPNAGTSEAISLSNEEQRKVLKIVMEETKGKTFVVPGILHPGIGNCIESIEYSKDLGVDAVMLITPYYNKPTQLGIYEYFKHLSEMSGIPIIIYNIPGRTGSNVEPFTLAKLAELDNIVGIKECNREIGQFLEKVRLVGDKISILAGDDDVAYHMMSLGARGGILATSNLIPDVWMEIYKACQEGQFTRAETTFTKYIPLIKSLFPPDELNPAPLKEALGILGKMGSYTRKPVPKVNEKNRVKIKTIMDSLNLI